MLSTIGTDEGAGHEIRNDPDCFGGWTAFVNQGAGAQQGTGASAPVQPSGSATGLFQPAEVFRGTQIYRNSENTAYMYETNHAATDADGAPNAYHPADVGKNCVRDQHIGLDCPANAGYPYTSWWTDVLVPDPDRRSQAFVQPSGPFKGFLVAMTSLRKPNGDKYDPATYVDATQVPYVVIPSGFSTLPHAAVPGDVGIATLVGTERSTTFIVGDSGGGPHAKLGEASIALYAALGFPDANPRTGSGLPADKIRYTVFPGSHRRGAQIWPRTNEDIHDQVMSIIAHMPGLGIQPS